MAFLSHNKPQEVPKGVGLTKSRRATVSPCSAASYYVRIKYSLIMYDQ